MRFLKSIGYPEQYELNKYIKVIIKNEGIDSMINIIIGGLIFGFAIYVVIKNTEKMISGEGCGNCFGSCSNCVISCNDRNDIT